MEEGRQCDIAPGTI